MPLSLLDEKVRSRLRTGVAITTMAQCVGELVENAIDAGAKCIAVRVDVSKYKIQVIIACAFFNVLCTKSDTEQMGVCKYDHVN